MDAIIMHKYVLSGMNNADLSRWKGVMYVLGSYGTASVWIRFIYLGKGGWLCGGRGFIVTLGF